MNEPTIVGAEVSGWSLQVGPVPGWVLVVAFIAVLLATATLFAVAGRKKRSTLSE